MVYPPIKHGYTVQCCPHCQNGMRWDDEQKRHVAQDDYDFKYWGGIRYDLFQMFKDAVDGRWASDVCKGNVHTLRVMASRERRMVWKLEGVYRKVVESKLDDALEFKKDHEEVLAHALAWDELLARAEAKYPDIKIKRIA